MLEATRRQKALSPGRRVWGLQGHLRPKSKWEESPESLPSSQSLRVGRQALADSKGRLHWRARPQGTVATELDDLLSELGLVTVRDQKGHNYKTPVHSHEDRAYPKTLNNFF